MKPIKSLSSGTQLIIITFMLMIVCGNVNCNQPPSFIQNIDELVVSENTPIGTSVGQLLATDPENSLISYGIEGTQILKVDSKSGIVAVNQPIDREKIGDSLKFLVTAEDDDENKIRVPVTVIILDENDTPPFVSINHTEVKIKEDAPIGTQIVEDITVTDMDSIGSILNVYCSKECSDNFKFELLNEPTTNELIFGVFLAKQIEYSNENNKHTLNLAISDGVHNTTLKIDVIILNVQNKPPVFIGSTTSIISEDALVGSLVMKIKAVDGDYVESNSFPSKSFGRPIIYELLTNPGNYFKLDSHSGELRVASQMDTEKFPLTNGVLTVKVRATEVGNNFTKISESDSSTVDITITLLDVNDEAPKFNHHSYTVDIDENVPNGTPLSSLDMIIQDLDSGSNSAFNIALVDPSRVFGIEPPIATGSTSVSIKVANGPLDYENPSQRRFILLIVATETFTKEKFSSTATVTVNVNDINDNSPTFEFETYTAQVSETSPAGTIITTIQASDRDSKNRLSYSLFGNGANLFFVNPSSGLVTVNYCETPGRGNCLDYESRTSYHLSFQADDGLGLSSVVSLIINVQDANDNVPSFLKDSYHAIIDEFATKFEPPLKVQAVDLDATSILSYSIVSGNSEDLFSIEERSGEIKVNYPVQTRNENVTLIVQASDGGKGVAKTRVNIKIRDRNDNRPIFDKESYLVTISESLPKGFFVEQVSAHDLDTGANAEIMYKIQRGAFENFEIEELNGIIRVSEHSKLDYDRRNIYHIEVIAVDRGIPAKTGTTTVTVQLLNYNNKAPYFHPTNQRAEINEAANMNTKFHKMKAIDPDVDHSESLRYSIESITAIDKDGKPIDATKDNRFMDFFNVDVDTGELFVASKLDRNIAVVVNLNMSVKDVSVVPNQLGFGNLWVNIVQYNKFAPSFGKPWSRERPDLTFSLRENQPIGTVVTNLIATDKDSKISHYLIDPPNDYFSIDSESGVISVIKNIDYEKLPIDQLGRARINFNAFAFDNGIPQLSCVANVIINVININDAVPVFNRSHYEAKIEENIQWNTLILQVKATDEDAGKFGKITYSLLNGEGNFVIDSMTGEIRIAAGANLDRERGPTSYTLQIIATDGDGSEDSQSISVPVYITILDTNDCSPQFHQRVYHTNIFGHIDSERAPVIQLSAFDPDEGDNGQVAYKILGGNVNDVFGIDPKSGVIYVTKSSVLMNPNTKEYTLRIEARDQNGLGPFFDEAKVIVKVVEMNRFRPKFVLPDSSTIVIEENLPIGTKIVKVEAIDEDKGKNGVIKYSFKDGDKNAQENYYLKIDEITGEIHSKIVFDRENKSEFQVILSAQDEGQPQSYETLQKLTILIKDIDDNLPIFEQREPYIFKIDENSPSGIVIGKLNAIDLDEITKPIYYYIVDGNSKREFFIEKMTGMIYTNASFDHEQQNSYELVVKASNEADLIFRQRDSFNQLTIKDRSFQKDDKSLAFVKVLINDLNDQAPYFERQVYRVSINYKSSIGEIVTKVKAIDTDSEPYSNLIYNIAMIELYKNNQPTSVRPIPSPFNLTNDGFVLTSQLMTQYPIDSRFVLFIEAREKVAPHRTAQTKVNVWLYDFTKLVKMTVKFSPEEVDLKREEIEQTLSNVTSYIAIISDIKYHVDHKTGKLSKKWSDIYLHFVNGIKEVQPDRIIEILDSNDKLHRQKNIQIKKVALASTLSQLNPEDIDVSFIIFITLCTLLIVGFISMIVCCICLKSWYRMKLIKETIKQSNKKVQSHDMISQVNDEVISLHGSARLGNGSMMGNDSASKRQRQPSMENSLWSDRGMKLYEEQELSMRLPNGDHHTINDDIEIPHYTTVSDGINSGIQGQQKSENDNICFYQEI